MDISYGVLLYGIVFLSFLVLFYIIQAYRKREKTYYIGAGLGTSFIFVIVLLLLNQKFFSLILFIITGLLSIVALPTIMEAQRREATKQLQKASSSAPLKGRDLLTYVGWLKLARRWSIWKTVTVYTLFTLTGATVVLYVLSIYGIASAGAIVGCIIPIAILTPIIFHHVISKALEETEPN